MDPYKEPVSKILVIDATPILSEREIEDENKLEELEAKILREEISLPKTITDEEGNYKLSISPPTSIILLVDS